MSIEIMKCVHRNNGKWLGSSFNVEGYIYKLSA